MPLPSRQSQRGAVLLAVLVIGVILSVLISGATLILQNRFALAETAQQLLKEKAQVYGKVAEMQYLVATQRVTPAGVSTGANKSALAREDGMWLVQLTGDEIRADGYPLTEKSDNVNVTFSLQAENGLVPVNVSSQFWLRRWLNAYQLSAFEQAKLADSLADYADPDELIRPAGAEARAYRSLGSPPPDYLLQVCEELIRVANWQPYLLKFPSMLSECNLGRVDAMNINAIPLTLWKRFWPQSAEKIARDRKQGIWLLNTQNIFSAEPAMIALNEDYYTIVGQRFFVIDVKSAHYGVRVRVERGTDRKFPLKVWSLPPK